MRGERARVRTGGKNGGVMGCAAVGRAGTCGRGFRKDLWGAVVVGEDGGRKGQQGNINRAM